ncbi:MAG: helix-turn-helix domain-containing protein [Gemmatimonadales bacterium]|nr:helix-turn-helix domain-containing protein [Gemmatimonadales bacterium]
MAEELLSEGQGLIVAEEDAVLWSVKRTAAFLNVSAWWVYCNQITLGAVKVGRSVKFPPAEIRAYLARRTVRPREDAPAHAG